MKFTSEQLRVVYDRTSGYCHICRKKLAFGNYGKRSRRGAWQVDHSNPVAKGGTHRLNNLYPSCIDCNLDKGTRTTKMARSWHGLKKAPLSVSKRREARFENAIVGGLSGGLVGAGLAGPLGAVVGAGIGAHLAFKKNPDR